MPSDYKCKKTIMADTSGYSCMSNNGLCSYNTSDKSIDNFFKEERKKLKEQKKRLRKKK